MVCVGSKFHIFRMCPPGEIDYFFTVDTVPVKSQAPEGKNVFSKIEQESDYINYTFDNEYMEELNNVQEKLKYGDDGLNTSSVNKSQTNLPEVKINDRIRVK